MDLPDPWPLSAAATAVLLEPGTGGSDLLKLSLKELVLRDVWRLERRPGGRSGRNGRLALVPTGEGVPELVPLPALHERLRSTAAEGRPVEAVVKRLTGLRSGLPGQLRHAAREELAARGLATVGRGPLPGTKRVVPTAAGEALEREAPERCERLAAALEETADAVEARHLVAAGAGVVLLVATPELVAALQDLDARLKATDAAGSLHPPELRPFDAFDASFDAAMDAGGGGDGGGGGGDGGGG